MILYGFWRSTATWRVRIALGHKQIAHEYRPVHLGRDGGEQHRPEYAGVNAMREVPVLEWEEDGRRVRLAQSMAILELLEERWPAPPLLPRGALARARARQLAQIVIAGIQPFQNTLTQQRLREEFGADVGRWLQGFVPRGLFALEATAAESGGLFLVGDEPSFADVCLVPQLYFARRFGIDLAPYPRLLAVEAACARLPAFEAAHADRQPDAEPRTPEQAAALAKG